MTQNNDEPGWIIYVLDRPFAYPAFKTFSTYDEAQSYWNRLIGARLHPHCKMERIDDEWLIKLLKYKATE